VVYGIVLPTLSKISPRLPTFGLPKPAPKAQAVALQFELHLDLLGALHGPEPVASQDDLGQLRLSTAICLIDKN